MTDDDVLTDDNGVANTDTHHTKHSGVDHSYDSHLAVSHVAFISTSIIREHTQHICTHTRAAAGHPPHEKRRHRVSERVVALLSSGSGGFLPYGCNLAPAVCADSGSAARASGWCVVNNDWSCVLTCVTRLYIVTFAAIHITLPLAFISVCGHAASNVLSHLSLQIQSESSLLSLKLAVAIKAITLCHGCSALSCHQQQPIAATNQPPTTNCSHQSTNNNYNQQSTITTTTNHRLPPLCNGQQAIHRPTAQRVC